ncbi:MULTISPECIES: tetratricopeptide repeat protein [Limibacillus]|uniref:tetratricopeptide repeat protein n=1 Tax=Limibacillus TaxID=1848396 RepID=UPI0016217A8E
MSGNRPQRLAEDLLAQSDVDPVAWRQLGISLGGLNQIEQARKALARAIELAPKDPQNHFQLGNLLLKVGRFADAEQAIRAALSLSPGDDRSNE